MNTGTSHHHHMNTSRRRLHGNHKEHVSPAVFGDVPTRAADFVGGEPGLGGLGGDALDGRQRELRVGAGQPGGLRLFGPALQVTRLQSVGPTPPTAHGSTCWVGCACACVFAGQLD